MRVGILLIGIIFVIIFIVLLFGGSREDLIESIFAEDIARVNVSTDIGDIQIVSYDGDEIRVQLQGKSEKDPSKNFKLTMKEKNNELIIKAKRKSRLFSFSKASAGYTILVELPSKEYENLEVHADVANIHVESIQANEARVTANVGNLTLKGINGVINAGTQVGDIEIGLQNIVHNIFVEVQVGNIAVETREEPLSVQTELKSSTGNSIINYPNEIDGSIGIGGPIVKLSVEVGNVSLLLSGE